MKFKDRDEVTLAYNIDSKGVPMIGTILKKSKKTDPYGDLYVVEWDEDVSIEHEEDIMLMTEFKKVKTKRDSKRKEAETELNKAIVLLDSIFRSYGERSLILSCNNFSKLESILENFGFETID